MKVTNLNKANANLLTILVLIAAVGWSLPAQAQEDDPADFYITPIQIEEEEGDGSKLEEEQSFFYQEDYYADDSHYYEEEVREDTSSVSMLTFNFLFYIVYKLKFSDGETLQETSKTADD